jgi:hypothetical protein
MCVTYEVETSRSQLRYACSQALQLVCHPGAEQSEGKDLQLLSGAPTSRNFLFADKPPAMSRRQFGAILVSTVDARNTSYEKA